MTHVLYETLTGKEPVFIDFVIDVKNRTIVTYTVSQVVQIVEGDNEGSER